MRRMLMLILILMLVSMSGCTEPIQEGMITKKRYDSSYTQTVPILATIPESFNLRITNDNVDRWIEVDSETYERANLGDWYE